MTDEDLERWLDGHRDIWPTTAKFYAWLRGGLRKSIWQFHPVKLAYKNKQVVKAPDGYNGRAKKIVRCALTGDYIGISVAEVDHVDGNVSLRCVGDILPFLLHLACPDKLQVVSKDAHKVKSYAEKMNISFDEALLAKRAIKIEGGDWKGWLGSYGRHNVAAKDKRKTIIETLRELENG